MKALKLVRELYKPIQPTVGFGAREILYREIQPHAEVRDFIYCYWQLKTKQSLKSPYVYRVVSDGCIDIFFNLNDSDESFIMGFYRKYTEFAVGKEFDYAGIRFYPAAFPQLFGLSAKSLSNQDQPLIQVLPEAAKFISKELDRDFLSGVLKLDEFFRSVLCRKNIEPDNRFYDALLLILKHRGHLKTEHGLKTGLSPRQLRRIFNYYIGTTPKAFSQVVRFQYVLNAKPSKQSLKENKIFYNAGFHDQAHFIKDFTNFYGVTPSKAFQ